MCSSPSSSSREDYWFRLPLSRLPWWGVVRLLIGNGLRILSIRVHRWVMTRDSEVVAGKTEEDRRRGESRLHQWWLSKSRPKGLQMVRDDALMLARGSMVGGGGVESAARVRRGPSRSPEKTMAAELSLARRAVNGGPAPKSPATRGRSSSKSGGLHRTTKP